jgi:hypothetical protein
MKAIFLFAIISAAAAASIQEVVDDMFDKYLPQQATWQEVKACRTKCRLKFQSAAKDDDCLKACPKFECPFMRISRQCDLFNSSMTDTKVCHRNCGHDFACHFQCPMAHPTTIKELQVFGEAMVCHTECAHDHACHKACHQSHNPWGEKQARCEKLHAIVTCMHNGGSHSSCGHLDEKTKTELMQEPWSLVKDVVTHVADYLLPLPKGQEVKACHMQCRGDVPCHKRCPKGVFGRFHDKCNTLEEASACHQSCEHSDIKCPFKKMECHFTCPMTMPTSVRELKGLTDHVLCHTTCGSDKMCHKTCPNSNWNEKKAQCKQYDDMVACHKQCGWDHQCHADCPHLKDEILNEARKESSNLVKDVMHVLVV